MMQDRESQWPVVSTRMTELAQEWRPEEIARDREKPKHVPRSRDKAQDNGAGGFLADSWKPCEQSNYQCLCAKDRQPTRKRERVQSPSQRWEISAQDLDTQDSGSNLRSIKLPNRQAIWKGQLLGRQLMPLAG